ncbi:MAG: peptide chain release factor N(5)-glutamine methyltransferase [Bacteroidales bacterium]
MSINVQTITDIRKLLRRELSDLYYEKEIDSVTNIIIKTLFRTNRLHYLAEPGFIIPPEIRNRISEIINELKTGKPVQYILGETEFYGNTIKLNPDVLIPRQETEELVDLIIKENTSFRGRIIDFATGSGCIAIALGKNLPGTTIFATDISPEAITLAGENAELNGVRIAFLVSDLMEPVPSSLAPAGIIVSNPPYVRESEKNIMHRNVTGFEPHTALFVPDGDPLKYYSRLLEISLSVLIPGGKVYFEINEAMGSELEGMMKKFRFGKVEIIRDLNGKDRIIKGVLNG